MTEPRDFDMPAMTAGPPVDQPANPVRLPCVNPAAATQLMSAALDAGALSAAIDGDSAVLLPSTPTSLLFFLIAVAREQGLAMPDACDAAALGVPSGLSDPGA